MANIKDYEAKAVMLYKVLEEEPDVKKSLVISALHFHQFKTK